MRPLRVPKAYCPALVAFRVETGPGTWAAHIFEDSKFLESRNSSWGTFRGPSARRAFSTKAPRSIRKLCELTGAAHYSNGSSGRSSSRKRDPSLLYGAGWEGGGEDVPVAVWWDFENCNVPQGIEVYRVGVNIVSGLRSSGFRGTVSISAYGDTLQLSRSTQEALASTGIRLHHVPSGGKDASDRALLVDLLLWTFDHPPPAHLFLISGDRDFSNALHRLRMRNYNILLACSHGTTVSPALLGAATHVWQWNSLVRGDGLLVANSPDGSSGGAPYSRQGGPRFYSPSYSPVPRAYDGSGPSPDGGMTSDQAQPMMGEGSSVFVARKTDATPVSLSQSPHKQALKDNSQAASGPEEGVGESSNGKPVLRQPPTKVLQQLRCLLQSRPEGLMLSDLQNYIREGKLSFEKDFYGHGKVVPFLSSIPEIVRLERVLMKDNRSWSYNLFLSQEALTGGHLHLASGKAGEKKTSVAPVISSKTEVESQDSKSSLEQILSDAALVSSQDKVAQSSDGKPDIRQPPKKILEQLRCLLKSHPDGMMLSDLQNYVRQGRLSFEEDFYGHRKVVPFLSSIPEVVRLERILMKDNKTWSYKLFLSQGTPEVIPANSELEMESQRIQDSLESPDTESLPFRSADQEQGSVLSSGGLLHEGEKFAESRQAQDLEKDRKEESWQAGSEGTSDSSIKGSSLPTFLGSVVSAFRSWRGKRTAVKDTYLAQQVNSISEAKDNRLEEGHTGESLPTKDGDVENHLNTPDKQSSTGGQVFNPLSAGGSEGPIMEGVEGLSSKIISAGKQPLHEEVRQVEKLEVDFLPAKSSGSTSSTIAPVMEKEETPTWKALLFGPPKEEPKVETPSELRDQRMLELKGSEAEGADDMMALEDYANSVECTLLLSDASNLTEAVNSIRTRGPTQLQHLSSDEILRVLGPSFQAKGVTWEFRHESVPDAGEMSAPTGCPGRDATEDVLETTELADTRTQSQNSEMSISKGNGSSLQKEETDANVRDKRDSVDEFVQDQPEASSMASASMWAKPAHPTFQVFEDWFLRLVNSAFKRSARIEEVGYNLSIVKPEFEREFGVRLDPRLYGYARVQDLVASIPSVRLSKPRVDQCTIHLQKADAAVLGPPDQNMDGQMKGPKSTRWYWPKMYHDCKSLVHELMLENPEGIPGSRLKPLFASRFSYPLDHKRVGCPRMSDLLRLMPDLVSVNGNLLVPSEELKRKMKKQAVTSEMVSQIEEVVAVDERMRDGAIFSEAGSDERGENWSEIDMEASGDANGEVPELSSRQEVLDDLCLSSEDENESAEIDSQADEFRVLDEEVLEKGGQKTSCSYDSEEEDERVGDVSSQSPKGYDFSEEIDELLLEADDAEKWLEGNRPEIDQHYDLTTDRDQEINIKDAEPILDGHLTEDWAGELLEEENQHSDLSGDGYATYSRFPGLCQEEEVDTLVNKSIEEKENIVVSIPEENLAVVTSSVDKQRHEERSSSSSESAKISLDTTSAESILSSETSDGSKAPTSSLQNVDILCYTPSAEGPGLAENMGHDSYPSLAEQGKTYAQDADAASKAEAGNESGGPAEQGQGMGYTGRSSSSEEETKKSG
ncbi:hypothetical protein R1sor_012905 [Riccia sorocarpa]|uniref:HTH OST-type domain-containing protein n=1 Tax=Riccia sorocarpa TaxID=122646 RepID=A0ABD3I725_9MARC